MKVICIHPRFAGLTSHHFNESFGFMEEFRLRGMEFLLLLNIHASAQIAAELNARAVLDDPTFRLEWSFMERSNRFLSMLHKEIDADLNANDRVMITVSTQLEAHALTRWLEELPVDQKPWIVIFILSDRWNRAGREEYERQVAEFRILKAAISSLASEDMKRLIFFAPTKLLVAELNELLGAEVLLAPLALPYGHLGLCGSGKPDPHLPRVAVLGGTRREKGSYLLPDIIRACRSHVDVEFLVHLANDTLAVEEAQELAHIADEPHVTVIREGISMPDYNFALNSTDIGLFPYEVVPYRKRTSGVFAEMVACGKPVVATRGTWMAEQIEAGLAAGMIFDDLKPDCIARAIARCVTDLTSLQQLAQVLSIAWRKNGGISAFVQLMEDQIVLRSA